MVRRGRKSREIMQKLIIRDGVDWDSSQYLASRLLAEFDEEVTVKRIRFSAALSFTDQADLNRTYQWAIVQIPTDALALTQSGIFAQMTEANLVVVTGTWNPSDGGSQLEYDHTITMRKLKGSSLWLILNLADALSLAGTAKQYTYSQVHYLEDI